MNRYTSYMILKSAIENLFGSEAWYALKESNHIPTWKKYAARTLTAVLFSIKETVEIYDEGWMQQIEENVERGIIEINSKSTIEEIIGVLAGIFINISFLQVGFMPHRSGSGRKYQLRKGKWKFNHQRQVVYLQTKQQKEDIFIGDQQRKIGFDAQFDLMSEHRNSGSDLSYSEWCQQNEKP